MPETVTCPACPHDAPSMDHLVDHISDEHGWVPNAKLDEIEAV